MTYCVGLKLNQGLVFMSDTLTNAGIDNVNTNKKMFFWSNKKERSIVLFCLLYTSPSPRDCQ